MIALAPILIPAVFLGLEALFGLLQGTFVHVLGLPPFLVTLAGMFLARGLSLQMVDGAADVFRQFGLLLQPVPELPDLSAAA